MAKNNNLQDFLTDIADAIRAKKGTSNPINPQNFSEEIASIETGGESEEPTTGQYLVQVLDYNGEILSSQHLDTGEVFTLPSIPTYHPQLTYQEWSSPVEIVDNQITVENSDIVIGVIYKTTSGESEFDITLTKVTGLDVILNMDGTKDWGDGTSDDLTTHTYETYGNYTITSNGTTLTASSTSGLFGQNSSNPNYYCTDIRFSESVTSLTDYALYYCSSLKTVTIPNSVTSIGNHLFNTCLSLVSLTLPQAVTEFGISVCQNCYSLQHIILSNNITSLSYTFQNCYSLISINMKNITEVTYAFENCYSLETVNGLSLTSIGSNSFANCKIIIKYDFTSCTAVPELPFATAFTNINALCKIIVPNELYDEWIATSSWTTYADYIYKAVEDEDEGGGEVATYSRVFSENTPAQISAVSAEISANSMTSEQVAETYGWNIGDTISYQLTTGENIEMRIIGFNHDDKSDGSGKAGITLEMTHCLATKYPINRSTTNAGGYAASVMKTSTLPTIKSTIPQEWQDVIKLVDKKSANGGGSNYSETLTLSEDIFLPSEIEVFGTFKFSQDGANEGSQYEYWQGKTSTDKIKKYDADADGIVDTNIRWWLRSSYLSQSTTFCGVFTGGFVYYIESHDSWGVAFGFCI